MLKLYSHPGSTYSKRVHIYCKYRNLSYEIQHVALDKLENRKKPFLEINPYGKVPVLDDGGFILYESVPILRYLEEKGNYSDTLFEGDLKSKAILNQKLNLAETEFCFPASVVYFAKKFLPEDRWEPKRIKDSTRRVERHLDILEKELQNSEYLSKNRFGILEIVYAPFLQHTEILEIKKPKAVSLWSKRVLEEKSVRTVLEAV